jgi:hypothetical protein
MLKTCGKLVEEGIPKAPKTTKKRDKKFTFFSLP